MKVRTRMAPSPTGELHIGGLRTALYDYAWAKKNNGQFILRIEDTDRDRLVEGALDRIRDDFVDYGLVWDEGPEPVGGKFGPYIQSQRLSIYKKYADELVNKDHAYYCFCTKERLDNLRKERLASGQLPGYDRHCRNLDKETVQKNLEEQKPFVIRLKVPDNEEIVFEDLVRGTIKTDSNSIDDQVLLKSDGFPTYHLAVVVDDHLMEITHIIRANEWIPSTPKHILLYKFLGWEVPKMVHLSVFLDPGGEGKMSKRKGSVSAHSFLDAGYLPEAMLNYLMLLGWNPGTEQEIFSLQEFVDAFDLKNLNKANQKFTYDKLNWFNQRYIQSLDETSLIERLTRYKLNKFTSRSGADVAKVLSLVKGRLVTLKDFDDLTGYFFENPKIDQKNFEKFGSNTKSVLDHATATLATSWSGEVLEKEARDFCNKNSVKVGDYFMILRIAVTGRSATPPLWDVMEVLGKEETLSRLRLVTGH